MIDWKLVDASVIAWAMVNGALLAIAVGGLFIIWRKRRQNRLQRVKDAIARYDKRNHKRGAVKALISKI